MSDVHRQRVPHIPLEVSSWHKDIAVQLQKLDCKFCQMLIAYELDLHIVELPCTEQSLLGE